MLEIYYEITRRAIRESARIITLLLPPHLCGGKKNTRVSKGLPRLRISGGNNNHKHGGGNEQVGTDEMGIKNVLLRDILSDNE
jgi:hypothetical protein